MKRKYVYSIILSVFVFISFILGIYFVNNYNKFVIYEFDGTDGSFVLDGSATFSRTRNILNMRIGYLGKEQLVDDVQIALLYIDSNNNEQLLYSASYVLEELKRSNVFYTLHLSEFYGYEEYFKPEVIQNFPKYMYLRITYKDQNGQEKNHLLKLSSTKYTNNKFIYKKYTKLY